MNAPSRSSDRGRRCTPDHPMPPDTPAPERSQWVHTDLLGFYDGVYYWEYECQNCGAKLEAMSGQ